MVTVGFAAPKFDCRAVVHGTIRRLRWRQVHEDKTLLLLFDASAAGGPADLIVLNRAAGRLHALRAKLAVVCRASVAELLALANDGADDLAFPLIGDADRYLAWLYNLVLADGTTLWGQFLIDPAGVVRQAAVSGFPVAWDVEELVRSAQVVARSDREQWHQTNPP
jgi:alkyl hydroperoxide reductase subunit AhpC